MTVRDFIAILGRLNPDAEVFIKEAARGFPVGRGGISRWSRLSGMGRRWRWCGDD
jgi:hypothetical protein